MEGWGRYGALHHLHLHHHRFTGILIAITVPKYATNASGAWVAAAVIAEDVGGYIPAIDSSGRFTSVIVMPLT